MRISYSRCSTYQHCPQRYKLQYVDRLPPPRAIELEFGGAVHQALSFMFDPREVTLPSLEQVIDVFARAWQESADVGAEEERQARFEEGVRLLQRFYQGHSQREEGRSTLATEQFFSLPFDDHHLLSGRIDRVDALPDNKLEVIDYKTTRRMPPQPVMAKDAQLAIYRLAADHLYPGREVTTALVYVLHDYEMRMTQTPDFLAEKMDEIRDVITGIEVGDFEPRPGPLCDWCGYRGFCVLYRPPTVPADLAEVDIAALLREYADLDAQEKLAESRLAELKRQIHDYLDRCRAERVEGGGYLAERRTSKRLTGWDEQRLREVLLPLGLWDGVTQVSSSAVRVLLGSPQLTREQRKALEEAATYAEARSLRVKPTASAEDEETEE